MVAGKINGNYLRAPRKFTVYYADFSFIRVLGIGDTEEKEELKESNWNRRLVVVRGDHDEGSLLVFAATFHVDYFKTHFSLIVRKCAKDRRRSGNLSCSNNNKSPCLSAPKGRSDLAGRTECRPTRWMQIEHGNAKLNSCNFFSR